MHSKQRQIESCEVVSKYNSSGENVYVLHSAINNLSPTSIAIALSTNAIDLKLHTDATITLKGHKKKITDIKFSKKDPSLLFSSSLDGNLCVWDVRKGGNPVQTFLDETDEVIKPLTCFDFNLNEKLVCAGTEVVREDSFLLFWDRRTSKGLGAYWSCHTEEITQVHFNPLNYAGMASSCIDGLINIFDLQADCEDDALIETLNTGCCVNKFDWQNIELSCLKSIEEYEFWWTNKSQPMLSLSREYLASNFKCKVDYLIDILRIDDITYLASGSNEGIIHLWQIHQLKVKPSCVLSNGHSNIVRTICYDEKANTVISGGEDGVLCRWNVDLSCI